MIDFNRYLKCPDCIKSGLYCTTHKIEVETTLRKREIKKTLQIRDYQSIQYRHKIKGLLQSYDIWKTIS